MFFSWGEGGEWKGEGSAEDGAAEMNGGGKRNWCTVGGYRIYMNFTLCEMKS